MTDKIIFPLKGGESWISVILILCAGVIFIIAGHEINDAAFSRSEQMRDVSLDVKTIIVLVEVYEDKGASVVGGRFGGEIKNKADKIKNLNEVILNERSIFTDLVAQDSREVLLLLGDVLDDILVKLDGEPFLEADIYSRNLHDLRNIYSGIDYEISRIEDKKYYLILLSDGGAILMLFILSLIMMLSERKYRSEESSRCDWFNERVKSRTEELEASLEKNKSQIDSLARANIRLVVLRAALERLQDASKYFTLGDKSSPLMESVVKDVMSLTESRRGFMALIDDNGYVHNVFVSGFSAEFSDGLIGKSARVGILGLIVGDAGSVKMDDLSSRTEIMADCPECRSVHSLLGYSILVGGMVRGVICLADKRDGTVFDADDEAVLSLFAIDVAHAMERMMMLEELHGRNAELESEKAMQNRLIDKLRQAQTQLLQTEKMASIGQLAAGVAHEINNPVGYINSNLNSLKAYLGDIFRFLDAHENIVSNLGKHTYGVSAIDDMRREIDMDYLRGDLTNLVLESMEGASRVIKIVKDLKEFSHIDMDKFEIVDIHNGLESTLNIVRNEIKYKAGVIKEYGDLPEIECVPAQINQVFMNILINAAHAIEEKGTITIKTGSVDGRVWVEISDNGMGIGQDALKRIFDPFFTTKPVGKGTGLGLSISYGIIAKHNGKIEVENNKDGGACFRVWLPVRHSIEEHGSPSAGDFNLAAGGN